MFRPVRIGAIQVVASDRTKEAPRIKVIVESSDKVNVIEMLPDMGADICAGDPEFLEQMDGHGNNLIDTNVRIRAETIANVSQVGLGIMQQRWHADSGWTTIKAGSRHSTDTDDHDANADADALSRSLHHYVHSLPASTSDLRPKLQSSREPVSGLDVTISGRIPPAIRPRSRPPINGL